MPSPTNGAFTITLTDDSGNAKDVDCKAGTKIDTVVPSGMVAILNGQQATRNCELRANDKVSYVRKSAKAA